MDRSEKVILTNMCMVYDKDKVLGLEYYFDYGTAE